MGQAKSKKRGRSKRLSAINSNAAGIDVGSQFHVVAVPTDRDDEPVRTFQSFTGDLHRLADWLVACRIDTVVMESTGVYWIPLYEILAARGLRVLVANARDVKHVPGRKTDVNDAQWLQQLHAYGLLRDYAASHIQHMQKALIQMNLQLHHVVSDITGKTGMRIIRAIIDGVHDPATLAAHRDVRCKASMDTIAQALEGNYRPEHLFALSQAVALYDTYQEHVADCDERLEALLVQLRAPEPPQAPLPAPRHKTRQPNALSFDVRAALYAMIGVDLTQIHGIGPSLALK